MTTVAILPVESATGGHSYQAFSGQRFAEGETAGAALDALSEQFPELADAPMIVVQRFRPDRFFSAVQQKRLQELMFCWREARDVGKKLAPEVQEELEVLVNAELTASSARAEALARSLEN